VLLLAVGRARDRLVFADAISKLNEGWKPCAFRLDGRAYVVAPAKPGDASPTLAVIDVVHDVPVPAPCTPAFGDWKGGGW